MFGHGMEKGPSIHLQGLRRMLTILGTSHLKTLPSQHILMLLAFQVSMEILLQLPHFLKVHYTSLSISVGSLISAGLPNIKGSFHGITGSCSGAFSLGANQDAPKFQGMYDNYARKITLDVSTANSIYGNSNTVTPASLIVNFYISY